MKEWVRLFSDVVTRAFYGTRTPAATPASGSSEDPAQQTPAASPPLTAVTSLPTAGNAATGPPPPPLATPSQTPPCAPLGFPQSSSAPVTIPSSLPKDGHQSAAARQSSPAGAAQSLWSRFYGSAPPTQPQEKIVSDTGQERGRGRGRGRGGGRGRGRGASLEGSNDSPKLPKGNQHPQKPSPSASPHSARNSNSSVPPRPKRPGSWRQLPGALSRSLSPEKPSATQPPPVDEDGFTLVQRRSRPGRPHPSPRSNGAPSQGEETFYDAQSSYDALIKDDFVLNKGDFPGIQKGNGASQRPGASRSPSTHKRPASQESGNCNRARSSSANDGSSQKEESKEQPNKSSKNQNRKLLSVSQSPTRNKQEKAKDKKNEAEKQKVKPKVIKQDQALLEKQQKDKKAPESESDISKLKETPDDKRSGATVGKHTQKHEVEIDELNASVDYQKSTKKENKKPESKVAIRENEKIVNDASDKGKPTEYNEEIAVNNENRPKKTKRKNKRKSGKSDNHEAEDASATKEQQVSLPAGPQEKSCESDTQIDHTQEAKTQISERSTGEKVNVVVPKTPDADKHAVQKTDEIPKESVPVMDTLSSYVMDHYHTLIPKAKKPGKETEQKDTTEDEGKNCTGLEETISDKVPDDVKLQYDEYSSTGQKNNESQDTKKIMIILEDKELSPDTVKSEQEEKTEPPVDVKLEISQEPVEPEQEKETESPVDVEVENSAYDTAETLPEEDHLQERTDKPLVDSGDESCEVTFVLPERKESFNNDVDVGEVDMKVSIVLQNVASSLENSEDSEGNGGSTEVEHSFECRSTDHDPGGLISDYMKTHTIYTDDESSDVDDYEQLTDTEEIGFSKDVIRHMETIAEVADEAVSNECEEINVKNESQEEKAADQPTPTGQKLGSEIEITKLKDIILEKKKNIQTIQDALKEHVVDISQLREDAKEHKDSKDLQPDVDKNKENMKDVSDLSNKSRQSPDGAEIDVGMLWVIEKPEKPVVKGEKDINSLNKTIAETLNKSKTNKTVTYKDETNDENVKEAESPKQPDEEKKEDEEIERLLEEERLQRKKKREEKYKKEEETDLMRHEIKINLERRKKSKQREEYVKEGKEEEEEGQTKREDSKQNEVKQNIEEHKETTPKTKEEHGRSTKEEEKKKQTKDKEGDSIKETTHTQDNALKEIQNLQSDEREKEERKDKKRNNREQESKEPEAKGDMHEIENIGDEALQRRREKEERKEKRKKRREEKARIKEALRNEQNADENLLQDLRRLEMEKQKEKEERRLRKQKKRDQEAKSPEARDPEQKGRERAADEESEIQRSGEREEAKRHEESQENAIEPKRETAEEHKEKTDRNKKNREVKAEQEEALRHSINNKGSFGDSTATVISVLDDRSSLHDRAPDEHDGKTKVKENDNHRAKQEGYLEKSHAIGKGNETEKPLIRDGKRESPKVDETQTAKPDMKESKVKERSSRGEDRGQEEPTEDAAQTTARRRRRRTEDEAAAEEATIGGLFSGISNFSVLKKFEELVAERRKRKSKRLENDSNQEPPNEEPAEAPRRRRRTQQEGTNGSQVPTSEEPKKEEGSSVHEGQPVRRRRRVAEEDQVSKDYEEIFSRRRQRKSRLVEGDSSQIDDDRRSMFASESQDSQPVAASGAEKHFEEILQRRKRIRRQRYVSLHKDDHEPTGGSSPTPGSREHSSELSDLTNKNRSADIKKSPSPSKCYGKDRKSPTYGKGDSDSDSSDDNKVNVTRIRQCKPSTDTNHDVGDRKISDDELSTPSSSFGSRYESNAASSNVPTVSYRAALSRERSASQERAANESRTNYGSGSGGSTYSSRFGSNSNEKPSGVSSIASKFGDTKPASPTYRVRPSSLSTTSAAPTSTTLSAPSPASSSRFSRRLLHLTTQQRYKFRTIRVHF
ncbi:protein split ends-like [Penaeus chinensis]|uniref:protein split ends-like n=1 Tax=Penaeus chinensis TaxID=139456 RepID=UPI001FB67F16|nr:protein split ends-like [Penaeus chinensis]